MRTIFRLVVCVPYIRRGCLPEVIGALAQAGIRSPSGRPRWSLASLAYVLHNQRYRELVGNIAVNRAAVELSRRDRCHRSRDIVGLLT